MKNFILYKAGTAGIEKEYTKCLRCGRTLKTIEAKRIGYGPVCLEKKRMETARLKLF